MKCIISFSSEGLGHSTRALALCEELEKKGYEVQALSYGIAYERFKKLGKNIIKTGRETVMTGKNGRFDLTKSVLFTSINFPELVFSYAKERRIFEKIKPSFIISDCRLSTTLAGAHLDIPTFFMANQTTMIEKDIPETSKEIIKKIRNRLEKEFISGKALDRILEIPGTIPQKFADVVLIPDFSPPNTISLPIISRDYELKKKTYFVGPVNPLLKREIKKHREEWDVIINLGGQQFRRDIAKQIESAFASTGLKIGIAGSGIEKKKGHVESLGYLEDPYEAFSRTSALVISGGHSSIMESILMEKPAVIIPDAAQKEQGVNAERFVELGLGVRSEWDELDKKISYLFSHYSKYKKNVTELSKKARDGENGVDNSIKIIEEFLQRIDY